MDAVSLPVDGVVTAVGRSVLHVRWTPSHCQDVVSLPGRRPARRHGRRPARAMDAVSLPGRRLTSLGCLSCTACAAILTSVYCATRCRMRCHVPRHVTRHATCAFQPTSLCRQCDAQAKHRLFRLFFQNAQARCAGDTHSNFFIVVLPVHTPVPALCTATCTACVDVCHVDVWMCTVCITTFFRSTIYWTSKTPPRCLSIQFIYVAFL